MLAVDRSEKARPGRWGYWIPDPGLLLGPQNPKRLQTYLMNWLRARPVWLYVLQCPGYESPTHGLSTQVWRDFLHGVPDDPKSHTKTGKRAYQIKQVFGDIFSDQELDPSATGEAQWREHQFEKVNDQIGPLVVWEIFELGFRYEFLALDRAMRSGALEKERFALLSRVFPSDNLFTVLHIPSHDDPGLFASLPHRRISSLNAFRDVLSQWPLFPRELARRGPLQISDTVDAILDVEMALAVFYTQTFFDLAGRAPIVPHRSPAHVM